MSLSTASSLQQPLLPSCLAYISPRNLNSEYPDQNPLSLPADLLLKKAIPFSHWLFLSPCPINQQVPIGQLGHFLPLLPHWSQVPFTFLSFYIFI